MKRIKDFIHKYSLRKLIKNLRLLLTDIISNARSGSQIALAIVIVPSAFLLITLLYLIILIKWISTNFFNLIRSLLTICIVELRFYWGKMLSISKCLAEELTELIKEMYEIILYLLTKITDDEAIYPTHHSRKSKLAILWRFITWLFFLIVSIMMSTLLIATFFTGLPLLHQYLRKRLMIYMKKKDDDDDTSSFF